MSCDPEGRSFEGARREGEGERERERERERATSLVRTPRVNRKVTARLRCRHRPRYVEECRADRASPNNKLHELDQNQARVEHRMLQSIFSMSPIYETSLTGRYLEVNDKEMSRVTTATIRS